MSILGGVATALVLVTVVIIVTMRYDKIQILPRFFGAAENCKQRIKTEEKARVNSVKQRTKTRSEVKMHNEKPIVCFPTAR